MRTPNSGRPKSEITGIQCTVAIRLTPALRDEYKRLGKAKWLRKLLATSLEENAKQNQHLGTQTSSKD
jgi:hypothetical protein